MSNSGRDSIWSWAIGSRAGLPPGPCPFSTKNWATRCSVLSGGSFWQPGKRLSLRTSWFNRDRSCHRVWKPAAWNSPAKWWFARPWPVSIAEVPTTLSTAASRPPHLRTWRDGWRHLRFLLAFSSEWLFFYPCILFALRLVHYRYPLPLVMYILAVLVLVSIRC